MPRRFLDEALRGRDSLMTSFSAGAASDEADAASGFCVGAGVAASSSAWSFGVDAAVVRGIDAGFLVSAPALRGFAPVLGRGLLRGTVAPVSSLAGGFARARAAGGDDASGRDGGSATAGTWSEVRVS